MVVKLPFLGGEELRNLHPLVVKTHIKLVYVILIHYICIMKIKTKKVYAYNWNNVITITRSIDGRWLAHYDITSLTKYLRDVKGLEYNLDSVINSYNTGFNIGGNVARIIDECKKSYGDI